MTAADRAARGGTTGGPDVIRSIRNLDVAIRWHPSAGWDPVEGVHLEMNVAAQVGYTDPVQPIVGQLAGWQVTGRVMQHLGDGAAQPCRFHLHMQCARDVIWRNIAEGASCQALQSCHITLRPASTPPFWPDKQTAMEAFRALCHGDDNPQMHALIAQRGGEAEATAQDLSRRLAEWSRNWITERNAVKAR